MGDEVRIYAGTRNGLQVFSLRGEHAEPVCEAFNGKIIQTVTSCGTHPERLFVGLREGVHRSDDAGLHWQKVLSGDIRSLTVDPSDDGVIYAGTDPVHLYRSEDGGESWEELASLQQLPEETHQKLAETEKPDMSISSDPAFRHRRQDWWFPSSPHQGHPLQIFVHPDNSDLIMLSIEHGGVAQSTDRGKSWEDVSSGIDYLDIHFVTSLPHRFDRYFVTSARGLYATNDPLKGWSRAQIGCDRNYFHDMTFLPGTDSGDPITIVATADGSPGVWRKENRGARAALHRSINCGESWERIGVGKGLDEEMDSMIWALGIHPDQQNTIIAAVGFSSSVPSPERGIGSGSVILSTDGGESWRTLRDNMPAVEHLVVAAG